MIAIFRKYYYKSDGDWVQKSFSFFELKKQNIKKDTIIWHKGICPLDENKHERPAFFKGDEGCSKTITADKIWGLLNPIINFRNLAISIGVLTLSSVAILNISFKTEININFNQYWGYQDLEGTVDGKTAKFRIAFLTNEFAWKFENELESENGNVQNFLPTYLKHLPDFHNSIGIIAVGTASEEGEKQKEISRAKRRMNEILKATKLIRGLNDKELFSLNLGQHKEVHGRNNEDVQLTIDQRKIAVIGIIEKDSRMKIGEIDSALNIALSDEYSAIQIGDYSNFDFKRGN